MRAIQVKHLPPTTHKGSRLKAFVGGTLTATVPHDYALNMRKNARVAAEALLERLKWGFYIRGEGALPNGDYVFTLCASPEKKDD